MLIASVINVVLDLVFVAGLHWGVAGAALATVTAQAFSALYCFVVVKKIDIVHTSRSDFEHVPGLNRKLLGLGAPILFQDVIISVGGLAVQFVINGYGFLFVAGFTATNKLYGVLEMAAISYGYAVVSYVGQNLGAGKIGRIKKGVHASAFLAFLTSAFISIMMFLFGKTLLSMFISGDPAQTEPGACHCMALSVHYGFLPLHFVFPVCLPFCATGAWKYDDSYAEWCCGIFCPGWCCSAASETCRTEWDFLCGDCRMDGSDGASCRQLLYQYS